MNRCCSSTAAAQLLARGVYVERYRVNGQWLVIAVDARGERILDRLVDTDRERDATILEFESALDRMDPVLRPTRSVADGVSGPLRLL